MELFDRYWRLKVTGDDFAFNVEPDQFGKSLRAQFNISASPDFSTYSGTIKVFNLDPDRRKQLSFNLLLDEFGTGPKIELIAGYKDQSAVIFDGALIRGYPVKDPASGTFISHMQVGLPFKQDKTITIPSQKVNDGNLFGFLKSSVDKVLNQPNRVLIKKSPDYDANFRNAIDQYLSTGNLKNKNIGWSGPSRQIIEEVQKEFNLFFYYDSNGFNVVSGKYSTSSSPKSPITIPDNTTVPELIFDSSKNTIIGSPIYTDTGAKIITQLRPELRVFQYIGIRSSVLNKDISVLELIHRGDTHGEDWYSEIDGSNFNQFIKTA
jgi:hypothetical protein